MNPDRDLNREAVAHILEAGEAIVAYTKRRKRAFFAEPMLQDAVIRRFEVMGEAAKRVSETYRNAHPEVPWKRIAGFRDVLIHGYDEVRPDEVWAIVEGPLLEILPRLRHLARQKR